MSRSSGARTSGDRHQQRLGAGTVPFDDTRDLDNARRGFLSTAPEPLIRSADGELHHRHALIRAVRARGTRHLKIGRAVNDHASTTRPNPMQLTT